MRLTPVTAAKETNAAAAPVANAAFVAELVAIYKEVDRMSKDPGAIRADKEKMANAEKDKTANDEKEQSINAEKEKCRSDSASKSGPSNFAEKDAQTMSSKGKRRATTPQQTRDERQTRSSSRQ